MRVALAYLTLTASKVVWNVLPACARSNAAVRGTRCFVVYPSAIETNVFVEHSAIELLVCVRVLISRIQTTPLS